MLQALCNEVHGDSPPRRMVTGGLDFRRFDQILAVLIKIGKVKLYNQDARVNVLGGAPAMEPAADAAMAAALLSSFFEVDMDPDVAFVGEVDLGGARRHKPRVKSMLLAQHCAATPPERCSHRDTCILEAMRSAAMHRKRAGVSNGCRCRRSAHGARAREACGDRCQPRFPEGDCAEGCSRTVACCACKECHRG
jgi:hypothetical protein